jgi:arylsulfatase A-like enzyme
MRLAFTLTGFSAKQRLWVVFLVLMAYFVSLSLFGTASRQEPADALLVAVLYACLAAVLHLASLELIRRGAFPGVLASLALGAVLVWHCHEQTRLPSGKAALAIATLAVAAVHFALVRNLASRYRPTRSWRTLVLIAACTAVVLGLGFRESNTFRWHLLRHNKLIGTPLYYLLAESMADVEERTFSEARSSDPLQRARPSPPSPLESDPAPALPNLVFILIDTLRADALAAFGGDPNLMPRLNRLAAGSRVFTNVTANSSWTKPSVAAFFTGLLPEEHGALDRGDALPDDLWTLAEVLRSSGYDTAAIVTNFAQIGRDTGFAQGFDLFVELADEKLAYARAGTVTDAVSRYLHSPERGARTGESKPLFLYVHFLDPHMPYLSGGRDSVLPAIARRAYDAELGYLDHELARLVDLATAALPGPTIIFVTSDHGEEFGEHDGDYLRHGHSLYSELLSIPAILRTPGGAHGQLRTPLEARDFYDLLIALSRKPEMDVEEWAAERGRDERHASVYLTSDFPVDRPYLSRVIMRGVEKKGFFFVWSGYGDTRELYDLERDPGQLVNVVRRHPALVQELSRSIASAPRPRHAGGTAELSEERKRQLRSLGYSD